MDDFIIAIFLPISFFLWLIFFFLRYYMHKKKLSLKKEEKRSICILLTASLCFMFYIIFFEDVDFVFDCRKETQSCHYYHSTIYNRELSLVKSYDLTAVNEIKILTRKRKSGRYSSRTVYRLEFSGPFESFEMPKDFNFKDDAEEQAGRIARFLQTGTPRYVYKDITPKDYKHFPLIMLVWIISSIVATSGIFIMLGKLFSHRK